MTPAAFLRFVRRDVRGGRSRLVFFTLCLALGVGAVVAVAGLAASVDAGIRSEARPLLAADIAVEARRPAPPALAAVIDGTPGARRTEVRDVVTIVAAPPTGATPGASRLVELRAVGPGYPFYGRLEIDPPQSLESLLGADGAVVAPEVLARLGLAKGGTLRIGGQDFHVTGVVRSEPGRIASAFALGPRIFVSLAGLERAALIAPGSRATYRTLIALAPETSSAALEKVAARVRAAAPSPPFEVQTFRDAYPELRDGLRRAARFLGLVALLSLIAGGIGVAETVRAWLRGRIDAIAVLRCLGFTSREVVGLYVGQTLALALVGSAAGIALGIAVQLLLPHALAGVLPAGLVDPWRVAPIARGLALGVAVALLFSLPPLLALQRVPPVRVLRRDAEPVPAGRLAIFVTAVALFAGVALTAAWQSASWLMGLAFAAGLAATAGALALAAWGVMRLVAAVLRRRAPFWLRQGLGGLVRPGAGTLGAVVAIGLGVLVVLGTYLVQRGLAVRLRDDLPRDAPNVFLVDIQPDQWDGILDRARAHRATRIDSAPMVSARLVTVNGEPVEAIAARHAAQARGEGARGGRGDRDWALSREQRLTWRADLPPGNTLVAGALWRVPNAAEASLEEEYAHRLGVGLGGKLRFDVQGAPVDVTVTSLRHVNWRTFGINFFVLVEPGVLDGAPQSRVANLRLPPGEQQPLQDDLAARYPNVILVPLRDILERIADVLERIGAAEQVLGLFTALSGIAILAGAVSAGAVRRAREVALLKTLGMTRRGIASSFAVEYGLVGLVAAAIGATGGGVLARVVLVRGMEIDGPLPVLPFAIAILGTIVLAVAAGLAASTHALRARPIEVLREG